MVYADSIKAKGQQEAQYLTKGGEVMIEVITLNF